MKIIRVHRWGNTRFYNAYIIGDSFLFTEFELMAFTLAVELDRPVDTIKCGRIDRGRGRTALPAVHCFLQDADHDLDDWNNIPGWEFVDGDQVDQPLGGNFETDV
jgi:hypothetical protein